MASFFSELKRRHIFRIGIVYLVVGWLLIQLADTTFPALNLPEWTITLVTVLVILGLPVALIIAWAFEVTPKGLKKTRTVADQSVAVLPFGNRSADKENAAFFADGVHDDLLTQLSRIVELKVISRTSVMQYRDTDKTIPEIGHDLGVAAILEGSVQRAGNTVRINVQLIDTRTDEHLWAETYNRGLTAANIFAIQGEIAAAIAASLQATLTRTEKARIGQTPTENLESLYAYQLGRQRLANRIIPDMKDAVAFFEKSVEIDPGFALGYVGIADAHQILYDYSAESLEEMTSHVEPAVAKALELDPHLAEAHSVQGRLQMFGGDYSGAQQAYLKAAKLNPNDTSNLHNLGYMYLNFLGRPHEALENLMKAAELDPLSAILTTHIGETYELLGEYDKALAQHRKALEIKPNFAYAHINISNLQRYSFADPVEALHSCQAACDIDPDNTGFFQVLMLRYLDLGDKDSVKDLVDLAYDRGAERHPNVTRGILYYYLCIGDDDKVRQVAQWRLEEDPGNALGLFVVAAGNAEYGREKYSAAYPNLFNHKGPGIDYVNYVAATDLASVLQRLGETDQANLLLENCADFVSTLPRLGRNGFGITDVRILALQGKKEQALATLRGAIDEGWRADWWLYLKHDPALEALYSEPEFTAMRDKLSAEMATQLARVREMQASSEIPTAP